MALKITCGFGRVGVRDSKVLGLSQEERQATKYSQGSLDQRYETFQKIFGEGKENNLSFEDFCSSASHIQQVLNNWTRGSRVEKAKLLEHFSLNNWKKLNAATKRKHSIVGPCQTCLLDHGTYWNFYNKQIKCVRVRNVLSDCVPHLTQVKRVLAEVQQVETKQKQQEKAKKRKYAKAIRKGIEGAQRSNNKDVEVAFGYGESLSGRRNRRLAEEFETRAEAETRTRKRKLQEEQGTRKCKKRLGNFGRWADFDREALKEEVNSYEDGTEINWKQLALKYDIKGPDGKQMANAGQLLKLWLQEENVDTDRFERQAPSVRIRRARLRVGVGSDMTVPKKRTEEQISKELSIMIRDGEVPIGEFVVPKTYKKYFLNKDTNNIETTTITMEGRKQHLLKVREQLLESQQPFMREARNYDLLTREQIQQRLMELGEYNEEETEQSMRKRLKSIEGTRHLVPWEDGATLANHGYIVYVVTTLYDPAIHLTDEEYYQKYNLRLSVQSAVEQPRIYIIARSKSSDAEQLLYSETRRDDLPSLAVPVTAPDGREYRDILRFCKGDCPSRQFEMGQQRGGFHPCLCAVDIREVHSFFTCTHVENPAQSMEDRQKFILDGPITSQKASSSLPDPFSQMTKEEMKDELTSRGAVPYETVDTMTKHDLQQEMKKMLRGIKRMPALLQPNPTQDLTELNLQHLEAPACESMHDLYNHTKNILEELPAHVSREVAETIQTVKTTILGNKDTVRAVDMRWLLLVLIKELEKQGQAEEKVMTLLSTLAEMQRLCYAAAEDRNMTSIFRMQNTMFLHHLMLRECFPGNPKNITRRKLWGQYMHSLRDHTPVIFRVAPISSLLAENEERQFGTFKRITKASANYANAGHIITNIFVRSHFQSKNAGSTSGQQSNKISETAKLLPQHRTRIPVALMKKHPRDAQAHCERVPDFLLPGYDIHWHIEEEVVVFHDAPSQDTPSHPTGQTPHHFRSTSIKQEHEYLQQTWERCLQEGVPMPISRIWVYEGQHLAKRMTTPFLDTGHVFTGQKYPYMEDISEPENPQVEEEQLTDEPDYGEMEETEDEEVIRMDRVDPEPELEQLEDETEIMKPDEQAAASQVVFRTPLKAINGGPCQSPSDIRSRTERRGLASCLSPESTPVSTPPRTPMREVERTTGNFDDESTKCSSLTTPTSARSGSVNLQGIMTPPATPCPVKNKSRDESKWRTKLGTALAVVLGDVPLVHQADKMKSKLKTAPKDKRLKAEYDTCIARISCHLSRQLGEDRREFAGWEKDFLVSMGRLPTVSDVSCNEEATAQEKRIRYAEHLLRHFGINLHKA
ncbi:PREDICTED: uncharacterized protein LOC109471652 [Branchiostoma belcheri]|uniref:Uncharacterized protein LOC109471652 n=1 Tax=Branchiostoma belcheri TaxID=7741 RepID=A0A6P4YQ76_BRABE|nr:PREDICTED: uncharacterized protein LOC109471652 [Branchiostoma belcheri]XP_019626549.1 PREDICTED: uncharacterized protein LOC109471652 [Branchiostoma belcheri]